MPVCVDTVIGLRGHYLNLIARVPRCLRILIFTAGLGILTYPQTLLLLGVSRNYHVRVQARFAPFGGSSDYLIIMAFVISECACIVCGDLLRGPFWCRYEKKNNASACAVTNKIKRRTKKKNKRRRSLVQRHDKKTIKSARAFPFLFLSLSPLTHTHTFAWYERLTAEVSAWFASHIFPFLRSFPPGQYAT